MTKAEFVKAVAKVAGENQVVVAGVLDAVVKQILLTVKNEGQFGIVDFGKFVKAPVSERKSSNFGRGQKVVPAHNAVRFKPSPFFKDFVNR